MVAYRTCPSCKGPGGWWLLNHWYSCNACNELGIVKLLKFKAIKRELNVLSHKPSVVYKTKQEAK